MGVFYKTIIPLPLSEYGIILWPTRQGPLLDLLNLFIFVEVGQNIYNEYYSKTSFLLQANTIPFIFLGSSGFHCDPSGTFFFKFAYILTIFLKGSIESRRH